MIDKETVLECIKAPMAQYLNEMNHMLGNWQPLEAAAAKLLEGQKVNDDEVPAIYLPMVEMMRLIAEVTKESEWDWANPAVQKFFANKSESPIYGIFTDAIVGTISAIIQKVEIKTLVEVGTGPGQVSAALCREMTRNDIHIPLIISDRAPGITQTREKLLQEYPVLTIHSFVWDICREAPQELLEKLEKPVLLFERFCLPYAGHSAIDTIAPLADVMIIQDDLSLSGRKAAFDILYGKIGTHFLIYEEAIKHLEKHFSFIHTCDAKLAHTINYPVTTFTLAIKNT
jgi:hypothetical protein